MDGRCRAGLFPALKFFFFARLLPVGRSMACKKRLSAFKNIKSVNQKIHHTRPIRFLFFVFNFGNRH